MNRLEKNTIMSRLSTGMVAAAILAGLLSASAQTSPDHKSRYHRYKLIDVGTLGGPQSIIFGLTLPLSNQGVVTGCADTSALDPNNPQNPYFFQPNYPGGVDPYVQHAFRSQGGVVRDLGTLPGATSGSCTQWINDRGWIVGGSSIGVIDPLTGYPEVNATLWRDGQIIDMGTLGGNHSIAFGLNNRGQAVGFALNPDPDPFAGIFGGVGATAAHAFLWERGTMRDLGTLGGPDSIAYVVNERGQAAGQSFTSYTPNQTTGVPTMDPFLWQDGNMRDLGTLGGTFSVVDDMNERGQIVGGSNIAGDQAEHPFLWDGQRLRDLGTFGGSNGEAHWINNAGQAVGVADFLGDQLHDAFLWKNGVKTDLGNLGVTSNASAINSSGQVVGASRVNSTTVDAFLWENSGPMVDLNSLVPPGSGLTLTEAWAINDRGEIAGWGELANGDVHVILLVPCDDHHPGQCDDYSMIAVDAQQANTFTGKFSPTILGGNESADDLVGPSRIRLGSGYRLAGQSTAR